MDDLTTRTLERPKPRISAEEIARRQEAVRQADANNRIEGIFRHPDSKPIVDAFVRGDFDVTELVPRLRARLGLS
jgi:Antitoxin VbhA